MPRGIIGITLFCILVLITCSPPPYGFVLNNQYIRNDFSGRELSGKLICMCPLLNGVRADTSGALRSDELFRKVAKSRSDLRLISPGEMENTFRKKWGRDSLNLFFEMLSKGEMLSLQTSDSLWKGIGARYFMALRVKNASTVKSFNRSVRKRVSLEAELWDCNMAATVWRVIVNGICIDERIPDSRFIQDAIITAYQELPVVMPAYDNKSW